jgi:hypothetical protein
MAAAVEATLAIGTKSRSETYAMDLNTCGLVDGNSFALSSV